MRVLIVNTSENTGGAAVASCRLMEALKNNGVKAKMLVRDKKTDQLTVVGLPQSFALKWNFVWERLIIFIHNHFSRKHLFEVDIANTGTDITSLREFHEADIIHLNWINQGMLSLKDLKKIFKSGKPVVWTMHDMWPCTGICHHARECTYYQTECHNCQYLYNGSGKNDLSRKVFLKKKKIYKNANLTFVTCSKWLGSVAQKSLLTEGHHVVTIPNTISSQVFYKDEKKKYRELYHLPLDKKIILFGSMNIVDKRKGVDYLIKACQSLAAQYPETMNNYEIAVLGKHAEQLREMLPFPVKALNYISEECKLKEVYNAVDMFVTPSLEENLPNMIMESMACGTPCVGFQVGGIPEMIDHKRNGYVANYKDADDLAQGIHWILEDADYQSLSNNALHKVASAYSQHNISMRYIDVYNNALSSNKPKL